MAAQANSNIKQDGITVHILKPFFMGDTLVNEFGFVNYYHSERINRFLHMVALPFLVFSLQSFAQLIDHLLPKSLPLKFSFVISVFYCIMFFLYDKRVGYAYSLLFSLLLWPTITFTNHFSIFYSFSYSLLILLTALIMQFIGHVCQGYSPAFRLFEAAFTTPAFLMLHILSSLSGYKREFLIEIENETQIWKQRIETEKQK